MLDLHKPTRRRPISPAPTQRDLRKPAALDVLAQRAGRRWHPHVAEVVDRIVNAEVLRLHTSAPRPPCRPPHWVERVAALVEGVLDREEATAKDALAKNCQGFRFKVQGELYSRLQLECDLSPQTMQHAFGKDRSAIQRSITAYRAASKETIPASDGA